MTDVTQNNTSLGSSTNKKTNIFVVIFKFIVLSLVGLNVLLYIWEFFNVFKYKSLLNKKENPFPDNNFLVTLISEEGDEFFKSQNKICLRFLLSLVLSTIRSFFKFCFILSIFYTPIRNFFSRIAVILFGFYNTDEYGFSGAEKSLQFFFILAIRLPDLIIKVIEKSYGPGGFSVFYLLDTLFFLVFTYIAFLLIMKFFKIFGSFLFPLLSILMIIGIFFQQFKPYITKNDQKMYEVSNLPDKVYPDIKSCGLEKRIFYSEDNKEESFKVKFIGILGLGNERIVISKNQETAKNEEIIKILVLRGIGYAKQNINMKKLILIGSFLILCAIASFLILKKLTNLFNNRNGQSFFATFFHILGSVIISGEIIFQLCANFLYSKMEYNAYQYVKDNLDSTEKVNDFFKHLLLESEYLGVSKIYSLFKLENISPLTIIEILSRNI